jgi:hypothetical protein
MWLAWWIIQLASHSDFTVRASRMAISRAETALVFTP